MSAAAWQPMPLLGWHLQSLWQLTDGNLHLLSEWKATKEFSGPAEAMECLVVSVDSGIGTTEAYLALRNGTDVAGKRRSTTLQEAAQISPLRMQVSAVE